MKKQILYLGGFELPDKNAAAQRVVANAKILRDLGYDLCLVGMSHDGKGLTQFKYKGFDCVNLPYPSSFSEWLRMLTSIKQYLPFYTKDTSMVIAYNHPAVALRKLKRFNQRRGIKTLSDCTEWYEPQGGILFRLIKGWDINQRMRNVHCKLDGIITISRFLDDFYKGKNVKTILLPPLVDKMDEKWHQNNVDSGNETIRLLYAGSPGGTKDRLDLIIEALTEITHQVKVKIVFDVIGITEYQYTKVYLKGCKKTMPDFVHFHGRKPHETVIAMLTAADFQIFIREDHLSTRAGFPTKFVETVSAGTIVLTNSTSNLKDYMIEGINSFELDISSRETLTESLKTPLLKNKEQLRSIQKNIEVNLFDYRNYIKSMKIFLDHIVE